MIAVIAGATGLVGSKVLEHLLQDVEYSRVISFSRRLTGLKHEKLTEVRAASLDSLFQFEDALKGDHYFCCLGTTIRDAGSKGEFTRVDYDGVVAFAKVAKANGGRSFALVSAAGANPNSLIFYNQVKGATEDALRVLEVPSTVVFRPGLLIGARKAVRPVERLMVGAYQATEFLLPQGARRRFATSAETLASRMVEESKKCVPGFRVVYASDI